MMILDSELRGTQHVHEETVMLLNLGQITVIEVVLTLVVSFFVGGYLEKGFQGGVIAGAIAFIAFFAIYLLYLCVLQRFGGDVKNRYGSS
ncbi:MAG: hypothetical protein WA021_05995 [Minisyncoccia bacterium]